MVAFTRVFVYRIFMGTRERKYEKKAIIFDMDGVSWIQKMRI